MQAAHAARGSVLAQRQPAPFSSLCVRTSQHGRHHGRSGGTRSGGRADLRYLPVRLNSPNHHELRAHLLPAVPAGRAHRSLWAEALPHLPPPAARPRCADEPDAARFTGRIAQSPSPLNRPCCLFAHADGLAINFALWAIIQSLFPAHVAAAPDSPAAAAAAPFARPVLGRSRLGPGRHDARPFVPPRAAFAAAAPRQPPRLPSEVERIFDELEMEDAVAATPEPLVRRQRAPRLEDELAALAIGAAFQQAAGSPGGSAAVDVIDLTADEAEAPPPPRAAGGRGGDALRRAALRPTQQHHHGSGAPAAGGGPPQRKVVSGMFYSAAPSAAARAARGG